MREDWIEVELKDLVVNFKKDIVDGPFGSNLKASEYIDEGIPVFKIQNIKTNRFVDKNIRFVTEEKAETLKRHSFIAGDLIITKLGDPLGLCCEVPQKYPYGIIVADLLRFRPNETIVNKSFLRLCINSNAIQGQLRKITKGTTRPRVNLTIVRELLLLLPPLPEQRAIVSKIEQLFSELDAGITSLKKAQEQLKVYRQAVLKKAFEGELTKAWRKKQRNLPTAKQLLEQIKTERENHYTQQLTDWKQAVKNWEENGKEGKKPAKPKKLKEVEPLSEEELKELPELPDGWVWEKLQKISLLVTDGDHNPPKRTLDGIPHLTAKNISNYKVNFFNCTYISSEDYEVTKKRYTPTGGDIIVTCVGTLGRTAIVPSGVEFSADRNLAAIRLTAKGINIQLLHFYLNTSSAQQIMNTSSGSTAQPHLYLSDIREMTLPIPSQKEQTQIVQEIESRLSVCDQVEENIQEGLAKAEALRQSILKKAFEGKLLTEAELATCKNEKDWEPAGALLERIQAEKAVAEEATKKSKSKGKKNSKNTNEKK